MECAPVPRATELPLSLDTFVDRKDELCALRRLVRHVRLTTLFGPAGIGKTRLALELAQRVHRSFSGGVHVVELGSLVRAECVVRAVAATMGVEEQPTSPLIDTLVARLAEDELLLVLDNCEHLVEACGELVISLLRRCPRLHILATSREALRLPGEQVVAVAALSPDAALQLFVDRAQEVAPAFGLTASNRPVVELICAEVDHLPLAIELAARLVRLLPLPSIADGLRDRFDLLTTGTRISCDRQRDLYSTIDWSYELLTPAEQAVTRRLSMAPGGFDLDLAAALCADLGLSTRERVELVSSLESKSLLTPDVGPNGQARFRQLRSVRAYGEGRLIESGERDATAERLVTWLAHAAGSVLDRFPISPADRAKLAAERDNLLRAIALLEDQGDGRRVGLMAALGLVDGVDGVDANDRDAGAGASHDGRLERGLRLVSAGIEDGRLTTRERQVAGLVADGLTNRQIGGRLGISQRTVETQLDSVRTKLDLRSRAQVAAWAAIHRPVVDTAPGVVTVGVTNLARVPPGRNGVSRRKRSVESTEDLAS